MRITPLDVRKQEFRRVMRGVDADEVYAFLATVADEYEAVLNDNKALRERLLELDDKVQEYRSIERTLRDTLLTAERVTVESKDNARREATLIIKEAQLQAEQALRDITGEAARLRQEVQRLRSQRDAYLAKMKVVAESHVKFIEAAEREQRAEDNEIPDVKPNVRPAPAPAPSPRPSSLFESRPAPSAPARPAPLARPKPQAAPSPSADAEPLDGLGDILDRLSQSQRDMLESSTTQSPPIATPTEPEVHEADETVSHASESEWNIEQIRRDLQKMASMTRPPDGPNG
jgi:cell division initiation protein